MKYNVNPTPFDLTNRRSQSSLDTRYVNVSGDTMTGDLEFPVEGFIMTDTDSGVRYRCTLTSDGVFTTAIIEGPTTGILTELSEFLLTETGDYLLQE